MVHRRSFVLALRTASVVAAVIVGSGVASSVGAAPSARADSARSCPPLDPAAQEVRADAIVEGRVLDIAPDGIAGAVRVEVRHVVKGTPPAELVLEASPAGEGVASEIPFHEGWPHWLLYLRETEPGSGQWYTSLCDGSRPIPASPESVAQGTESASFLIRKGFVSDADAADTRTWTA